MKITHCTNAWLAAFLTTLLNVGFLMAQDPVLGWAGEAYVSAGSAQINRLNYLNRTVTDRVLGYCPGGIDDSHGCCPKAGVNCGTHDWNYWISGYGLDGGVSVQDSVGRYNYTVGGLLLGVDCGNDALKYGAFYGYGQTTVGAEIAELQSKDHTLGAYAKWDSLYGGGYSFALLDFSFGSYEGTQNILATNFDVNYDGWQAALLLEKGWKYKNVYGGYVNPFIDLQYLSYYSDAFEDDFLQYGAIDIDSLRTILGFRLWQNFCYKNTLRIGVGGALAWHHELLDTDGLFIANYEQVPFPVVGNGGGRDWIEMSLAGSLDITHDITLSGNYYLYFNQYTTINAGMATLTWRR